MATPTTLLDLPVDILHTIIPYLDAPTFLAFTSTCTALHSPQFLNDSHYWSTLTRDTFRVPNQPVAQTDGVRWQKLYKRLRTQSRIYTWGNNEKGCLGHSSETPAHVAERPELLRRYALARRHISWPVEMQNTRGLGVVSDVQCGGWSTTMLTAKGALYTVGVMDGLHVNNPRHAHVARMQAPMLQPTVLRYPPGFVPAHERHDVSTAIRQFSAGRAHVLGLSDSGRIWTWQNVEHAALHVKFLHHETREKGQRAGRGTVRKVVAGWNKSAALIEGAGIVLWDPLQRRHDDAATEDAALVLESAVVPKTDFRRSKGNQNARQAVESLADSPLDVTVGEVLDFVLLEHVVLFNTSLGKAFASQIIWDDNTQRIDEPIELCLSETTDEDAPAATEADPPFATSVQGSFRSCAVFTSSGAVLTTDQDRLLDLLLSRPTDRPLFTRTPALQNHGVISVAFGDYHYHALHSSGHIASYGNEPQGCGALGLGGHGDPEGRLRGIRYQGIGGDGRLVPHAYAGAGRRVWFEEEKKDWIKFITAGGVDPAEAAERMRMALGSPDVRCQGEVSDWIEQEGADWETKFAGRGAGGGGGEDDDGLGAYFALSVTAAGWHSGALVLVNEELAERVRRGCEVQDPAALEPAGLEADGKQRGGEAASSAVAEEPSSPSRVLSWAASTALDYSRWFLGLAPYNAPATAPTTPVSSPPRSDNATAAAGRTVERQLIHAPRSYGDSPRQGYKYAWARDSFPRLRLSYGVDMPGTVAFDEWRFGRPGGEG
ncbi:hypothetical protein LTR08_001508 [Meristemomyces frigidus]|nr:hypothetical protein LTR08_001508 [Meristemomyces frigidus]